MTIITYFSQFPGSAIIFLCKPRENPYGLYAGIEFYKIVAVTKNRLASSFLSSTRLQWVSTKINAYTYADQGWSAQKSRRWLVNLQQASLWKWILHMLEISILSPLLQDFFFFFNIVYQKISNMPLDAHKSTHIFEKQVISAANAVKFLFLLYCYLLTWHARILRSKIKNKGARDHDEPYDLYKREFVLKPLFLVHLDISV